MTLVRNKIILVDNDLGMLLMLERLLKVQFDKHFHLDIYIYTNVLDALDSIRDARLIVTDYYMSDMDGVELCHEIGMRGYKIPIIIFSAFADYDNELDLENIKRTKNQYVEAVIHKNDIEKIVQTVGKFILPRKNSTNDDW
jgi:CheY-like chemotaxis protein